MTEVNQNVLTKKEFILLLNYVPLHVHNSYHRESYNFVLLLPPRTHETHNIVSAAVLRALVSTLPSHQITTIERHQGLFKKGPYTLRWSSDILNQIGMSMTNWLCVVMRKPQSIPDTNRYFPSIRPAKLQVQSCLSVFGQKRRPWGLTF